MSTGLISKFRHQKILLVIFLIQAIVSTRAYAELYNRRNLLPGGRAAALGGAFTALSDDASGTWYNPSGLAFTKGNDVSMSANAYTRSKRSVVGAVGNEDVSESSSSIYPAFAGGTTGFGSFRLGYAYFTSDREHSNENFRYDIDATADQAAFTYARKVLMTGEMIHAGVGFGINLGPYLSIGASEFYYRRSRQVSLIESSVYSTGATFDSTIQQKTLNEGGVGIIGSTVRLKDFSIGLVAKFPKRLADNTSVETSQVTFTSGVPQRNVNTTKPHGFEEPDASEYNLGMAYQWSSWLMTSIDAQYIAGSLTEFKDQGGVSTAATNNYSAGMELSLSRIVIRGGYFTNNSMVRKPDSTQTNQPASVDYIGWSSGLSLRSKSFESSLGFVKQIGRGFDQSVGGSSSVYAIEGESMTLFLTSKYSL
ncbi:MAG: hypothetical protein NT027_04215 [Proteobacteria bacterium]|nr:hypothetical protein [Pseudomonadota bacterium]